MSNDNYDPNVEKFPVPQDQHVSSSSALDDEQRVKVLSPGMLVVKRFIRNRLAITGFFIIIFMFLFSFVGGLVIPYDQDETFEGMSLEDKEYAAATYNRDFRFITVEGGTVPDAVAGRFAMAIISKDSIFEAGDKSYLLMQQGVDFYLLERLAVVARAIDFNGEYSFTIEPDFTLPQGFDTDLAAAVQAKQGSFIASDGIEYFYKTARREYTITRSMPYAIASKHVFDPAESGYTYTYDFVLAGENAFRNANVSSFTYEGETYTIERGSNPDDIYAEVYKDGKLHTVISNLAIQAIESGEEIALAFRQTVKEAIDNEYTEFYYAYNGVDTRFELVRKDLQYIIRWEKLTAIKRLYEPPSWEHWLGLDGNSMDILTRVMYGGRISLTIGFVVVLLEVAIGVVLGGIAGFFGKWVDNLIMRIVDIFNCIPAMPLYIILGSVMDSLKVDPGIRIYYLMIILGLIGWPSIARMVRGQILSLREQEFMTAAEALGIKTTRRIFRHLVPNVIPQLIVLSTMTLGSIIITESTLSFLGLGVRYPMASWGNIINAVNDPFVMTNYLYVWIPAGFLILLTVLGFNFIGDGLRDAFDPKMKR